MPGFLLWSSNINSSQPKGGFAEACNNRINSGFLLLERMVRSESIGISHKSLFITLSQFANIQNAQNSVQLTHYLKQNRENVVHGSDK